MRGASNGSACDWDSGVGFRILHEFPSPSDEKAWRQCLSRSDWPSHYTSPEFFAEPFWTGKRPFAVLAVESGRVAGILTGVHEGSHVTSGNPFRPQICVDRTASVSRVAAALTRGFLAEAGSTDLGTIFSWTPLDTLQQMGFRAKTMEGSVVLDLTRGPEFLFKKLHQKRRRNVRFAIKRGVEIVQAATHEDFCSYYDVYLRWRQTSRKTIVTKLVPFSVLKHAYRLRQNRILFLARYQGKTIAGDILRFCPGGLVEASANNSVDEFLHLKPNDLLVWKTIEWACEAGFTRMSLGGAHHFLREYGGTIEATYRYRRDGTWLRRYDMAELLADNCRRSLRRAPAIRKTLRQLLQRT